MRKRAFLLGVFFSAFVAVLDPYLMILRMIEGRFTFQYWAPGAIFVLFLLCLISCMHRRLELTSSELLFIFIMTAAASVLPSLGFITPLITIVAGFKYLATPANMWVENIIDKAPEGIMIRSEQAVTHFYEGLPAGEAIPYLEWLVPMSFFLLLMIVLSFLSICLMVLFRKQWVEKERLIYPLMILPLEMVRRSDKSRVPDLFKNRIFWLGCSAMFLFYFLNWFLLYLTGHAFLALTWRLAILRRTILLTGKTHFPILGLSFLLPCSVSLSFWLFFLIFTLQSGFLAMSGYRLPGVNEIWGGSSAVTSFQGGGAMLMLVFALFWRARKHLAGCVKKAFMRDYDIDDSDEMLSYRTAVFGSVVSFLIMVVFMRYFGMPWITSFVFLFFTVVVFFGLTRIVCQTGLPAAQAQCNPPSYTAYLLPPSVVTSHGYVALGLQYNWTVNTWSSVMASTGQALKVQEEARISPRLLFVGIMTAIVVSYAASSWMHIYAGYKVGALNVAAYGGSYYGELFMSGTMANYIDTFVTPKVNTPLTRDIIISRYLFTGIGAIVMGALMFLHSKFLWWPVHYIAFPIAESMPVRVYWFSIFLAWLIKISILRFGGHNVYKKSVPFFLGIIMGNIIWVVIESLLNITLSTSVSSGWFAR